MLAPRLGHAMNTLLIDPENILMAFSAGDAAERFIRVLRTDGVKAVAVSADRRLEVSPLHECIPPRKRKIIMDASPNLRSLILVAFPAYPGNGDRVFPSGCVCLFGMRVPRKFRVTVIAGMLVVDGGGKICGIYLEGEHFPVRKRFADLQAMAEEAIIIS